MTGRRATAAFLGRTSIGLFWLALVTAPEARAQSAWPPRATDWFNVQSVDVGAWRALAASGWYSGADCAAMKLAVNWALSDAAWYYGETNWGALEGEVHVDSAGAYHIIIDPDVHDEGDGWERADRRIWETVIHESVHYAEHVAPAVVSGIPHLTSRYADCHSYALIEEEEEGDDDDNNAGAGGGGGGGTIVSKTKYHVPGVWVIWWIPPSNGGGTSIGEVQVVCDYDPDTWWPDCPDMEEEGEN